MSNSAGSPTPAGWYRDPGGTSQLRWWDGAAWTANLSAPPIAQPSPPPAEQAPVIANPYAPQPIVGAPVFPPEPQFQPAAEVPGLQPAPPVSHFQPAPPVPHTPGVDPTENFVPSRDPSEAPYVPFKNAWSSTAIYGSSLGSAEFARPSSWNTVGGWLLATSFFWGSVLYSVALWALGSLYGFANLISGFGLTSTGWTVILASGIIVWLLMILAAARDQSSLRRKGFLKPSSALWILLVPPLVYLIIRTVRVRSEAGRGQAPLVFFLVSVAAYIALSIAAALIIPALLLSHGGVSTSVTNTANASSLASGITAGLDNSSGGNFSVSCTPFAKPSASATDVTCIAVDLKTQTSHTLIIQVTPGSSGGQPSVKLLNVTPPIADSGS